MIRLYDWDPRNDHRTFLGRCEQLVIKVLVPVSAWFLRVVDGGFQNRRDHIPKLIESFTEPDKRGYHPVIEAIIIGNELQNCDKGISLAEYASRCIEFTKDWAQIEQDKFHTYGDISIGHPIEFNKFGGSFPCWAFWDPLLAALNSVPTRNLNQRIILAPQTYNTGEYLFQNAEGSGKGYVDLTWEKYHKRMLFTEFGASRMIAPGQPRPDYAKTVIGQLSGCLNYSKQHHERLTGGCFFQFADKCWKKPDESEGSYGAFMHTKDILCTLKYSGKDFTHWDVNCDNDVMNVDRLTPSPLYETVKSVYNPK